MRDDGIRIPGSARDAPVHSNVRSPTIVTTEDKARIAIGEYERTMKQANTGWHTPLALCLSLLGTLTVADFRVRWGIEPAAWQAVFVMLLIVNVGWFVRAVMKARKHEAADPAARLLDQLKGDEPPFLSGGSVPKVQGKGSGHVTS
tara:strand:- start:210 stop:647 length:438 start_codon:yes stop_codon:yes gene_type:complete